MTSGSVFLLVCAAVMVVGALGFIAYLLTHKSQAQHPRRLLAIQSGIAAAGVLLAVLTLTKAL